MDRWEDGSRFIRDVYIRLCFNKGTGFSVDSCKDIQRDPTLKKYFLIVNVFVFNKDSLTALSLKTFLTIIDRNFNMSICTF